MIDGYKFIKKSIQSVDGVYDLISDDYIKWASRIIENEKLNVPSGVLEYLNNELVKLKLQEEYDYVRIKNGNYQVL